MPCKSKKQCSYIGAIAGGAINKKGLSKSKAKEMVRGVRVSKLPLRSKKK